MNTHPLVGIWSQGIKGNCIFSVIIDMSLFLDKVEGLSWLLEEPWLLGEPWLLEEPWLLGEPWLLT